MRYDTKIESKTFPQTLIFFDENDFSKDFEKSKISKSHFFRFLLKNSKFSKSQLFRKNSKIFAFSKKSTFSKKVDFLKFSISPQKHRKIWFLESFNFQNILKKYLSSKKCTFSENVHVFFKSYLMYNLSEWHRGTPTVPPMGTVNVPPKIRKIKKIRKSAPKNLQNMNFLDFRIFGGTFTAPTGGTVGVPRCHSLRLYMRYDKKIK